MDEVPEIMVEMSIYDFYIWDYQAKIAIASKSNKCSLKSKFEQDRKAAELQSVEDRQIILVPVDDRMNAMIIVNSSAVNLCGLNMIE